MKKYTICLASLVALSVFAGCGSSSAADEGRAANAQTQEAQNAGHGLVGEAAPKFSVKALTGEDVSVEAKGKPYIINFWATWCPPCQAEIPDLAAFYAAHRETVDFYAVNLQEEAPAVQKFLTERQAELPVVLDAKGKASTLYGVRAIPTTVVVNAEGTVIYRKTGGVTKAELEDVINKH